MSEFLTQPWPYAVVFTAIVLGRNLKFWGWGFGMEVNHEPVPKTAKPAPRRSPGKRKTPKRRKK
jgi:hypothetical protein